MRRSVRRRTDLSWRSSGLRSRLTQRADLRGLFVSPWTEFPDTGISGFSSVGAILSPYVAAFLVSQRGRIVDIDTRPAKTPPTSPWRWKRCLITGPRNFASLPATPILSTCAASCASAERRYALSARARRPMPSATQATGFTTGCRRTRPSLLSPGFLFVSDPIRIGDSSP